MPNPILFYEPEYYSPFNFSSFAITWKGSLYMTTEHIYQSEKFENEDIKNKSEIMSWLEHNYAALWLNLSITYKLFCLN